MERSGLNSLGSCVGRYLKEVSGLLECFTLQRNERVNINNLFFIFDFKFNFNCLFKKEIYIEHRNILTAIHDQDLSVNLPSGSC